MRHWSMRIYEFLQWCDLEMSCNETMRSMVIVIAEDAGQCVLGMDSSSAKNSVSSDEIRLRTYRSDESWNV